MAEVARKAGRREERAVMALSSFMFEMDPNAFLERKEKRTENGSNKGHCIQARP